MTPSMIGWTLGMIAAFAMIYFALPKKLGGPTGPGPDGPAQATNSKCEADLVKLLVSIDPERVQFNIDLDGRLGALNRFWTACGPSEGKSIVKEVAVIQASLTGETLERALSTRFNRRDLEHLRQAVLFQQIAKRLAESKSTDIERIISQFVYVAQQLEPLPSDLASTHPLTPYECMLFGEGTAEDRGWVLAELLRQLHFDAVAIRHPQGNTTPLIGVLLDKEVLLYDPAIGFPIPAIGESQRTLIFREPATLKAALADDAILRQLDLEGEPYPWTAADLQAATIGLIGTTSTWSPRMADIQFQIPPEHSCVIYDGLGKSEDVARGLLQRVTEAVEPLGYASASVRPWLYPETQTEALSKLGGRNAPHILKKIAVLAGPYRSIEGVEKAARETLQRARARQLLGQWTEAIEAFHPIHQAANTYGTSNNAKATELSIYWTAATQYENHDYAACIGILEKYLHDYPLGNLLDAIHVRLAACLSIIQEYDKAAEILTQIKGPHRRRCQLLARRLREIAALPPPPEAP